MDRLRQPDDGRIVECDPRGRISRPSANTPFECFGRQTHTEEGLFPGSRNDYTTGIRVSMHCHPKVQVNGAGSVRLRSRSRAGGRACACAACVGIVLDVCWRNEK